MKLYTAKASPFGRTVEIVVRELALDEDVEVMATVVAPAKDNPEFQAINPLRKIPTLVLEDGTVLPDSTLICRYLAERVGDAHLFAVGAPNHFSMLAQYYVAKGIAECAVSTRYETFARPQEVRWESWASDQLGRVDAALANFERDPPATPGRLTIAAVALAAALGYLDFRFADFGWRERYPSLVGWLDPIAERPSFQATAPA